MKYNLSNIMKSANTYAKIMDRGDALRKAWANEKAKTQVQAISIMPSEMQKGDRVAIQVGSLWGEVRWYTFTQISRNYDVTQVVAAFDMGAEWPPLEFVLSKGVQCVVERRVVNVAEKAVA